MWPLLGGGGGGDGADECNEGPCECTIDDPEPEVCGNASCADCDSELDETKDFRGGVDWGWGSLGTGYSSTSGSSHSDSLTIHYPPKPVGQKHLCRL